MYLAIIILPLLGSIASGFFGRKIGITGAQIITSSCVITTTLLAIVAFFEVGLNNIPVTIELFRWIDSESLNVIWGFRFDSLTVSMLIPVLIVSSLVHIYSIGYMSHDPHIQRFFSYLSLFTFMMIILVTGNNLLLMFVGWEGVGVCSYLLVCFWFTRIAANQSSLSAFLTNRVGDAFLTVGMFAVLWAFGNIDYATIFSLAPYINENVITMIGICLVIGAMAKSSQVGLHVWLPLAMEGPTPVSALIHAATMVTAGVYLLMRSSPLIEYSSTVLITCLWLGAITTVFSSLIGLFQQDIKKVIAYSTMSQLGMMVIAIGLSSYNVALFHLVNHAFYKALLFLGAGAVIHAVGDNQDFRKYGGLKPFLPLTYSVMLIASLSLVAFPFMTGFYSKDFILESAYGQFYFSSIVVYFVATIGAMFTTLYSVKVLYLTFLTNPNGPIINYKHAHEGDIFMSLPLIILAVFSIFFGYITKDLFIGLGSGFFADNSLFIHPSHEIMLDTEFAVPVLFKLLPLIFTISLSILAILYSEIFSNVLISFKFSRIGYNIFSFFNQRFFVEMFYNKYIANLALNLGGQTTKVIDKGSVELLGPYGLEQGLVNLSKSISRLDTGVITSYALYILIGLIFYILVPQLQLIQYMYLVPLLLLSSLCLLNIKLVSFSSYGCLQWILNTPPKPHKYINIPLQSKIPINKILGWFNANIVRILIVFTIGLISRHMVNNYFGINVFIDYLNIISVFYYLSLSSVLIYINSYDLSLVNFVDFNYNNIFNKLLQIIKDIILFIIRSIEIIKESIFVNIKSEMSIMNWEGISKKYYEYNPSKPIVYFTEEKNSETEGSTQKGNNSSSAIISENLTRKRDRSLSPFERRVRDRLREYLDSNESSQQVNTSWYRDSSNSIVNINTPRPGSGDIIPYNPSSTSSSSIVVHNRSLTSSSSGLISTELHELDRIRDNAMRVFNTQGRLYNASYTPTNFSSEALNEFRSLCKLTSISTHEDNLVNMKASQEIYLRAIPVENPEPFVFKARSSKYPVLTIPSVDEQGCKYDPFASIFPKGFTLNSPYLFPPSDKRKSEIYTFLDEFIYQYSIANPKVKFNTMFDVLKRIKSLYGENAHKGLVCELRKIVSYDSNAYLEFFKVPENGVPYNDIPWVEIDLKERTHYLWTALKK